MHHLFVLFLREPSHVAQFIFSSEDNLGVISKQHQTGARHLCVHAAVAQGVGCLACAPCVSAVQSVHIEIGRAHV